MKHSKLFLAFGCGCLAAIALGHAIGVSAELDASTLEGRVRDLEETVRLRSGQKIAGEVVAPFELRDRFGKIIFNVDESGATLYGGGKAKTELGVAENGGLFTTVSGSGNSTVNFGVGSKTIGLEVQDKAVTRVAFGKDLKEGNFALKVFSGSGQNLAGIGESLDHQGAAAIYDANNLKALLFCNKEGKGLAEVLGVKGLPIAQLTESSNGGGRLWLGNAGSVGMVEAGDAGGYGIVRAGPRGFGFIPTPGLALPGSVIVGKR